MAFKSDEQRKEYFRAYRQRKRAQKKAAQQTPGELSHIHYQETASFPLLDLGRPYTEHRRPYPLSSLAEQDGNLFYLATLLMCQEN
jgi:hypothetical protein